MDGWMSGRRTEGRNGYVFIFKTKTPFYHIEHSIYDYEPLSFWGRRREEEFLHFFLLLKTTNTYTFLTFCEIP